MASPNTTAFERPDIGMSFSQVDAASLNEGYVGLQVAPIFDAMEKTGTFPVIPDEALMEERETKRAPKSGYQRGDWEFGQDSFLTEEHGAEELIDDNLAAQYRYAIDYEMVVAARAQGIVLRNLERDIATALQNTSTFTATAAATAWTSFATADPQADVFARIEAMEDACGMRPDTMVLTDRKLRDLRQNAKIIDQIKYSGRDDPKMPASNELLAALAAYFDLDRIVVANKLRNSAKKGQAVSYSKIWTTTVVGLYKTAKTQDLEEPCVARTFHWAGDGSSPSGVFETYRDESKRSDVMRFRHERKLKVLYASCGQLLTDC